MGSKKNMVSVKKGLNKGYRNGDFELTWCFDDSYLKNFGSKVIIERVWEVPGISEKFPEKHKTHTLAMQFCDNTKDGFTATTEDVEKVINQFGFTLVD